MNAIRMSAGEAGSEGLVGGGGEILECSPSS